MSRLLKKRSKRNERPTRTLIKLSSDHRHSCSMFHVTGPTPNYAWTHVPGGWMSIVHQVEWLSWWAIINNSSTETERNNNTEVENSCIIWMGSTWAREKAEGWNWSIFFPFSVFCIWCWWWWSGCGTNLRNNFLTSCVLQVPLFLFLWNYVREWDSESTLCNSMLLSVYVYACVSESPMMRREKINQKGIKMKRRWSLSLSGIFIMWI